MSSSKTEAFSKLDKLLGCFTLGVSIWANLDMARIQGWSNDASTRQCLSIILAVVPFCVTALFCIICELTNRHSFTLMLFQEVFTILGVPMTVMQCLNLYYSKIHKMLAMTDCLIIFPVAFYDAEGNPEWIQNILLMLINLCGFAVMFILFPDNCVSKFKMGLPLLAYTCTFVGFSLDILLIRTMREDRLPSRSDWQILVTSGVQTTLHCITLYILSNYYQLKSYFTGKVKLGNVKKEPTKQYVMSSDFDPLCLGQKSPLQLTI